jgi:hypothetical protein
MIQWETSMRIHRQSSALHRLARSALGAVAIAGAAACSSGGGDARTGALRQGDTATTIAWDYVNVLDRNILVYADTDSGAWFAEFGSGSTVDNVVSQSPWYAPNPDGTWSLYYYIWAAGPMSSDDWLAVYTAADDALNGSFSPTPPELQTGALDAGETTTLQRWWWLPGAGNPQPPTPPSLGGTLPPIVQNRLPPLPTPPVTPPPTPAA